MAVILKLFYWIVGVIAALFAILFIAGQAGLLRSSPPAGLGVKDGRLKAPATSPNSVSSQADLYPDHPQRNYARIAPLAVQGAPAAAMDRLASIVQGMPGCVLVKREGSYLYAECSTRWLRFTDDLELWLDDPNHAVQVRSSSRLGEKDFGVNRTRVESIRAAFKG